MLKSQIMSRANSLNQPVFNLFLKNNDNNFLNTYITPRDFLSIPCMTINGIQSPYFGIGDTSVYQKKNSLLLICCFHF